LRGGSWNNNADNSRVAYRNNNTPDNNWNNNGFRLLFALQLRERDGFPGCEQIFILPVFNHRQTWAFAKCHQQAVLVAGSRMARSKALSVVLNFLLSKIHFALPILINPLK
jgi:hypothetical protein